MNSYFSVVIGSGDTWWCSVVTHCPVLKITSGSALGTIWQARYPTHIGHMQGKNSSLYLYTILCGAPVLQMNILNRYNIVTFPDIILSGHGYHQSANIPKQLLSIRPPFSKWVLYMYPFWQYDNMFSIWQQVL